MFTPLVNPITDLSTVKSILNINDASQDSILTSMIMAATYSIENYCDRHFTQQDFNELIDAQAYRLIVKNRPVNLVKFLGYDLTPGFGITNNTGYQFTVQIFQDSLNITLSSTFITTSFLFSDYPLISDLVNAINSTLNDMPCVLVNDGASQILYTGIYQIDKLETYQFEMVINCAKINQLYDGFYSTETNYPHLIIYNGGYSTFPDDLITCCNMMVIYMYENRNNLVMSSETMGNYSYSKDNKFTHLDPRTMISQTYVDVLNSYKNIIL